MSKVFILNARRFVRFAGAVVSALTSRRANRFYRACLRFSWNAFVFLAFVLMTIALVAFWLVALGLAAADRAVARCERPAPVCLVLPATPAPVGLLPAAAERVLVTPPPIQETIQMLEKTIALPAAPFEPIVASREVAVSASKLRSECDRLRSYCTDEAAYTMDERKRPNFQGFMQDLEQCAREVARLYCKRSKSHDSYKASLINRANTLIERSRSPQVAKKRHLQAAK